MTNIKIYRKTVTLINENRSIIFVHFVWRNKEKEDKEKEELLFGDEVYYSIYQVFSSDNCNFLRYFTSDFACYSYRRKKLSAS